MMRKTKLTVAALALALAGCSSLGGAGEGLGSPYYSLVRVGNRQRRRRIARGHASAAVEPNPQAIPVR